MYGICSAIKVKSIEESLKFYIDGIGYSEYKRLSPQESTTLVFLKDHQGGLLELIGSDEESELNKTVAASNVSVVIGIKDLEKTLTDLEKLGFKSEREPFKVPSGEYIAFIKDPNGVEVELIENFMM